MYDVNPKRILALRRVMDNPQCVARMDRMLAAMKKDRRSVAVLDDLQIPQAIRESGWVAGTRQGALDNRKDPDIVFSAFTWPTKEEKTKILQGKLYQDCIGSFRSAGGSVSESGPRWTQALLGCSDHFHYERRPEWKPDQVCWSLHDLHSAWGCLHRCSYCARGGLYVIMLNVEEFIEHVDGLMAEHPWQKVLRYDVEQDCLAIEPEYGASRMLVEHFAELEDKYLILFSKSANVDFLLDLDHKGHTIMLWTLSSHDVSRQIEPKTGTMEQRIEAARKCQEAGYTVRFKCKPVIPLKNWREQTTHMLETLFSVLKPDNLSMEVVFFAGGVAEMDQVLGVSAFDEDVVAACRKAEESGPWDQRANGPRPFPFEVKREVYRHFLTEARRLSPETPVTLCAETQRMWDACGDLISMKPWNYVCNCGPHCTPRRRAIENIEGPDAARIAKAVAARAIPPAN
ncbi:MAG: spore photoproduct lyase family protein [Planctomycetota bacterium]